MQVSFGLVLFLIGLVSRMFSIDDNKRIFLNKIRNQGLLNIILGGIGGVIQYLNTDLTIISMIVFAVGILFSFIYLIIKSVLLIKNSSMKKK
jgi:hypothetical protein